MSDYQTNKINNKLGEIRNKLENLESSNVNDKCKLDKLIKEHGLVDYMTKIDIIKSNISEKRELVKTLQMNRTNSNRERHNIPNTYLSKLEAEKNIWIAELERIEIKTLDAREEYIQNRADILEDIVNIDIAISKTQHDITIETMRIKEYSGQIRSTKRAIIQRIKDDKGQKKENLNAITKIESQIKQINNKEIDVEYQLTDVIPRQKREANKSYHKLKNSYDTKNEELSTVNAWITELVDDININGTDIDKHQRLTSYWKQRDNLEGEIKKLNMASGLNVYNIYLKCEEKKKELLELKTVYQDTAMQLSDYKSELLHPPSKEDDTISIDVNNLKHQKKLIRELEARLIKLQNDKEDNQIKLKETDKLIQTDDATLKKQEGSAHERWEIMQVRIEEWKHDAQIQLSSDLDKLDSDISNINQEILSLDKKRHEIQLQLEGLLGQSSLVEYQTLTNKIQKTMKQIEKLNAEIAGLELHL